MQQHQPAGQTRRAYRTSSTTRQNVSPTTGGIVSRVHTEEVVALFTSTDGVVNRTVVVVVVVVVGVIDDLFDVVKSVIDVKTDEVAGGE